jgi:hypothetical protein
LKIITGKTGEPHVASADDGALHAAIFGTGDYIINLGEDIFEATIIDNNNITIGAGEIVLQGRHCRIEYGETENISIDSGEIGYDRYDLICVQYDNDGGIESAELVVLKGTPSAAAPVPPTPTTGNILQGDTLHQFVLYLVYISGINVENVISQFSAVLPLGDKQDATQNLSTDTTLVDADTFPFYKASTMVNRKSTWSNIKAKLKAYFDTLYAALSHTHGNITNDGKVGADANKVLTTTTAGAVRAETQGTAFNKAFGTDNPAMDGTASAGSAETVSRADHVHPSDTSKAAASHTQAASTITAGTLGGKTQANATAAATLTDAQVRDIYAGTDDMTVGVTSLTTGAIYCFYETE